MSYHAGRKLFKPKFKECTQCPSCPFREGNDVEFSGVVNLLRRVNDIPGLATDEQVLMARLAAFNDILDRGDFLCHQTVYQWPGLKPQLDSTRWRQCPGATLAFRTGELPSVAAQNGLLEMRNRSLHEEELDREAEFQRLALKEEARRRSHEQELVEEIMFMQGQGALTRSEKQKQDAQPTTRRKFNV